MQETEITDAHLTCSSTVLSSLAWFLATSIIAILASSPTTRQPKRATAWKQSRLNVFHRVENETVWTVHVHNIPMLADSFVRVSSEVRQNPNQIYCLISTLFFRIYHETILYEARLAIFFILIRFNLLRWVFLLHIQRLALIILLMASSSSQPCE